MQDSCDCPFTCIDIQGQNKEQVPTRVIFRRAQILPEKETEKLPQATLVFNCPKRILKLDGFPVLLKESCEIIECGRLADFGVI